VLIDLIAGVERTRLAALTPPPSGARPDARGAWHGDTAALEAALRARVAGEVRFDAGSRALYATDASNYRQVPIGVVVPRDADDVLAALAVARTFGAPILARGGGTSLAGQCCNVAVVLDCSKYFNRILEINPEEGWARVEPGLVTDELNKAVAQYGLIFGPDPATHDHNTYGGMIGNNSCGMHAQMAGKCEENVLELDVVTYDGVRLTVGPTSDAELAALCGRADRVGDLYRQMRAIRDAYAEEIRRVFPDIPRRVSGYPLQELLPEHGFNVARALVGTECTCAFVLSAKVRLVHNPAHRVLLVLGFADIFEAADRVPQINAFRPLALEGLDETLIDDMRLKKIELQDMQLLPRGAAWLMAEFGDDDKDAAIAAAQACQHALRGEYEHAILHADRAPQQDLKELREAALGASTKRPNKPENHEGWEDSAVPPDKLGAYLRDLRALFDKYGYDSPMYGHFGQACVHCRITFDFASAPGVAAYRSFMLEAAHLIKRYGGSLSGEHGDGQAKAAYLNIMYSDAIVDAFRAFKHAWDPEHKMNPGKVVDPYPPESNLREGPHYEPWNPRTRLRFQQQDYGSFAYAANRCVGVGKCRRHEQGTMCPSYRVTREEMHSTRGRARLLFEMLEGEPLREGWQSEAVKEALDLCLACKGCKGDCPVNVDMASYKAEFLSHYYERKRRPIWAYAFGLIPWWAHLASFAPRVVNAVSQTPPFSSVAKALVRMAPRRTVPLFAEQSFRAWWRARGPRGEGRKGRVVLWADTFNTYLHATTAQHAVEVLEAAGYAVSVPAGTFCCGRPLYDYGMLDLAQIMLRQILDGLREEIEAGTPIVVLEPSCASVFVDELMNLLPDDEDAKRLSRQVTLLGDFLTRDPDWTPPQLDREAILHGHCHQKAERALGMAGTQRALERSGVRARFLDDGCCGMAGAFGFEAGEHYDVSIAAGELAYLPAVREAPPEQLVVADGFSCREQVMQTGERQPLHLADVLWLALHPGAHRAGAYPESAAMPDRRAQRRRAQRDAAVGLAAATLVLGGVLGTLIARGRR